MHACVFVGVCLRLSHTKGGWRHMTDRNVQACYTYMHDFVDVDAEHGH